MGNKVGAFTEEDEKDLDNIDSHQVLCEVYALDSILKHQESQVSIYIKIKDIQKFDRGSYGFVKAKAVMINEKFSFNNKIEIGCQVACKEFYKLRDIKEDKINILDYFSDLFPSCVDFKERKIGLFTFQNGIQNTFKCFEKMGNSILSALADYGKPFCIGFYNSTDGIIYAMLDDLQRLLDSWLRNPNSVLLMRQLIYTLEKKLPENILWTHIAHSEAGLISHHVLTTKIYHFRDNVRTFIKERLAVLTYGAVTPVPDETLKTINTYSHQDITMRYAKKHLDKLPLPPHLRDENLKKSAQFSYYQQGLGKKQTAEEIYLKLRQKHDVERAYVDLEKCEDNTYICQKDNYTLHITKSLVPRKDQGTVEGDHAFLGDTYKKALKRNLDSLAEDLGIHGYH